MAGSQIATSVTILNSLKGFQAVSLTEYNTSAAAAIADGSVVEIAGAFFTFVGDEPINASTWSAIATGSTAYITLTPSGTAGSQIVDAAYTATAPVWRDDLQGWYASAASNVRVIGTVFKNTSTSYIPKYLYNTMQDQKQRSLSVLNATVASVFTAIGPVLCSSSLSVTGQLSISHMGPRTHIATTVTALAPQVIPAGFYYVAVSLSSTGAGSYSYAIEIKDSGGTWRPMSSGVFNLSQVPMYSTASYTGPSDGTNLRATVTDGTAVGTASLRLIQLG